MRTPLRMLLGVGAVLMLFLIGAGLYFEGNGQLRFLAAGSQLGTFETRISSVEEEFMRRSPALQENYSRFQTCMRGSDCNAVEILIERNRIIRTLWPEMLTRLMVHDDWGAENLTVASQEEFLEDVQKVGGAVRAQDCFPIIEYRLLSHNQQTTYRYTGLQCPAQ